MVTSIVSVLTGIPVRKDIAMTGEVTLRGNVLPIGGLKEKLMAAQRGGIKTVLIPEENAKDLTEIPDNVKSGLTIIPVSHVREVLKTGAGPDARAGGMGRGGRGGRSRRGPRQGRRGPRARPRTEPELGHDVTVRAGGVQSPPAFRFGGVSSAAQRADINGDARRRSAAGSDRRGIRRRTVAGISRDVPLAEKARVRLSGPPTGD